jgi:TatD DNase family protein
MITDSHAHVFWRSFDDDRAEVLERARAFGVERMVVVGTDVVTSRAAFEVAAGEPGLFPTAGIHPHDALGAGPAEREAIEELCLRPECVGVGETGLDFFKELSPRREQIESFYWHLDLARRLAKPVVVHCRDAADETARILREFQGVRGMMHCYTFGPAELEPFLSCGFFISFSGVVTYPRNEANRAAARAVPEDRLLVETDCPYLAPQARRGERNEPAFVVDVLAELARVRETPFERLAAGTSSNAARLFGLDDEPGTRAGRPAR